MNKIAIRADGGPKIGMGHITRCLALAEELARENCSITFITKKDEATINLVSGKGFKSIILPELSIGNEINFVIDKLRDIDVLITDSYDIDLMYLTEIKKIGVFLVTIDDLNCLESYPSDIVINGNIYAKGLNYRSTYGQTKFLLGPEYTLLRKEFIDLPQRKIKEKCENILITMGGSDPNNLTLAILEQLYKLDGIRFHVVVGPAFEEQLISHLLYFALNHDNIILYQDLPADKMRDLMLMADIAISAGGSTLYELAATGTPAIALITADNQFMNVKKMSSLHLVISNDNIANIKNDVNQLIDNFDERKRLCYSMQNIFSNPEYVKIKTTIFNYL